MTSSVRLRLLKPLFVLAVVLGLSTTLAAPHVFAQGDPTATIVGAPTTAVCDLNGAIVPAGERGGAFDLLIENFPAGTTSVVVNVTFPDGRVFASNQATALAILGGPLATPAAAIVPYAVPNALVGPFGTNNAWPAGCYTFTVTNPAVGASAVANYVLLQPSITINPSPASISVTNIATNQPTGPQGATISITGRGFRAGVPVFLDAILPDGTTLPLGFSLTNNNGLLGPVAPAALAALTLPVGTYAILATEDGIFPPAVPYQALANYLLTGAPQTVIGGATARVSAPIAPVVTKGVGLASQFQVIGTSFAAGSVAVSIVLPNGSVISALPLNIPVGSTPVANAVGNVAATLTADPRLPTGTHIVVLSQTVAGNVLNRASTAINLVAP